MWPNFPVCGHQSLRSLLEKYGDLGRSTEKWGPPQNTWLCPPPPCPVLKMPGLDLCFYPNGLSSSTSLSLSGPQIPQLH